MRGCEETSFPSGRGSSFRFAPAAFTLSTTNTRWQPASTKSGPTTTGTRWASHHPRRMAGQGMESLVIPNDVEAGTGAT